MRRGCAFRQAQEDFGPADYHALVFGLREQNATLPLAVDPRPAPPGRLGLRARLLLARADRQAGAHRRRAWQQADLADALERVWDEYYPIQRDLAFELARIFVVLKRPEQALRFCQRVAAARTGRTRSRTSRSATPACCWAATRRRSSGSTARWRSARQRIRRRPARQPAGTHAQLTGRRAKELAGRSPWRPRLGSMMSGRRSRPCPSEARWSSGAGPAP